MDIAAGCGPLEGDPESAVIAERLKRATARRETDYAKWDISAGKPVPDGTIMFAANPHADPDFQKPAPLLARLATEGLTFDQGGSLS